MKKVPSIKLIIGAVFCVMGFLMICTGVVTTFIVNSAGSEMMLFLYIFGGIGLLFLLIGLPFLIMGIRRKNTIARLLETGVQAEGVITDVVRNRQVTVNGRHPYKAECQVTDPVTGEVYLYSSGNVMKKIDYLVGRSVTVYYDPDDRRQYFVDIESAEEGYNSDSPEVHDFRNL